jgi:hypothetical protein
VPVLEIGRVSRTPYPPISTESRYRGDVSLNQKKIIVKLFKTKSKVFVFSYRCLDKSLVNFCWWTGQKNLLLTIVEQLWFLRNETVNIVFSILSRYSKLLICFFSLSTLQRVFCLNVFFPGRKNKWYWNEKINDFILVQEANSRVARL